MEQSQRRRNLLPSNLPQLQNLIKRDPSAYHEEVGSSATSVSTFIFSFLVVSAAVPPLPELTAAAAFVSYAKSTQLRRNAHISWAGICKVDT